MFTYLISYDLKSPGQNYSALFDAIKGLANTWCHALDSVWVINSVNETASIRDALLNFIDRNDGLLVTRLTGDAAWYGLDERVANWLKTYMPKNQKYG